MTSNTAENESILDQMAKTRSWSLGLPESPVVTKSGTVLFLRSAARESDRSLYEHDPSTGATTLLVSPESILNGSTQTISPEEQARRERMRVTGGGFTSYHLSSDGQHLLLSLNGKLYTVTRDQLRTGKSPRVLVEPRAETEPDCGPILDPKFSPDGRFVSFVRGHELHVVEPETGGEIALTAGGSPDKPHGLAEFIAQEEMGRFSGYWWSPNSRCIVYEQADLTRVEWSHIANPSDPSQPPRAFRYPRAGQENAQVRLGIVSVTGGETTWIDWDVAQFPYLACVHWREDSPLTIQVQSRDQRRLRLLQVDGETGKTTELLALEDEHWLNLHDDRRSPGYLWLPHASGFLWAREDEDGWALELRSPDGFLLRTLTTGEFGLRRLVGLDKSRLHAIVEAGPSPQKRLWRVPLEGGEPQPLLESAPAGLHTATLTDDGEFMIHVQATPHEFPKTLIRQSGPDEFFRHVVSELPSVGEEPPTWLGRDIELTQVGDDKINVMLIRPNGFDPSRRYPVVVSVYGGPHATRVNPSRAGIMGEAWLAEHGFVVVSIDGRGSWGRGRRWERPLYRHLGTVPLEDQAMALRELGRQHDYLDLDRVGIFGWSFGGYLSALAVMLEADLFKAAIAGAPVTDWADYDSHYTERYMGRPQDEPEAYLRENPIALAPRLRRPLLLIHGTADDNVYFSHSLKLADALLRAGRRFELVPLANQTHRIHDLELFRRQWELIAEFFRRHLM